MSLLWMPAYLTLPFKALATTVGTPDKESPGSTLHTSYLCFFMIFFSPPSWQFYLSRDQLLLFYIVIQPFPSGFHLQLSAGHGKRAEGGGRRRKKGMELRRTKKWGLNEPSSEIKREPKGEVSEKRSFIEYRSESERETTMFEVGA